MTGNKKEFIDTNILVYAYNSSEPMKQGKARSVLSNLWLTGNGCLSIQVLQEFYTVVTRKIPKPITLEFAATIIEDLSNWNCHVSNVADILQAIKIQQRYQVSFWDAQIICSARKLGCEILWSEDFQHGQVYNGVMVRNPFVEE